MMVKGFVRLTEKYSGDEMYIRANQIKAIIPLKSFDRFDETTEGSAVYLDENSVYENNYLCALESPKSVMTLMEMAEMAAEK